MEFNINDETYEDLLKEEEKLEIKYRQVTELFTKYESLHNKQDYANKLNRNEVVSFNTDIVSKKYWRLLAKHTYTDKRDNWSESDKTTSQYVSDGGEAWDIVPEKYWFVYDTCKNPLCQEDEMDWFTGKFYCDEECKKNAAEECEKIKKECGFSDPPDRKEIEDLEAELKKI